MGTEAGQERIGKLEAKIDALWDKIMDMASNLAVMTANLENLTRNLDDVKRDVDEIKASPKNKWDTVVKTIITVLVTGFVAYLIAQANAPVSK